MSPTTMGKYTFTKGVKMKVLEVASNEVGYLEKTSRASLDSKTENAGKKNFTKYWEALAPACQGNAWCQCFVNWCFTEAYGDEMARNLLCSPDNWSYYTPTASSYFKKAGRWHEKSPQAGDIIYFKNSVRIYHVGIIEKVDSNKVYTIEGNTSAGAGVIENGGGVARKSYPINYSKIAGYGRPNYDLVETPEIGWHKTDAGLWYYQYGTEVDDYYQYEWKVIDNHWFWFNHLGYLQTGYFEVEGKYYYSTEQGLQKTNDDGSMYLWEVK